MAASWVGSQVVSDGRRVVGCAGLCGIAHGGRRAVQWVLLPKIHLPQLIERTELQNCQMGSRVALASIFISMAGIFAGGGGDGIGRRNRQLWRGGFKAVAGVCGVALSCAWTGGFLGVLAVGVDSRFRGCGWVIRSCHVVLSVFMLGGWIWGIRTQFSQVIENRTEFILARAVNERVSSACGGRERRRGADDRTAS